MSEQTLAAQAATLLEAASGALRAAESAPHGPACTGATRKLAGDACVALCAGDQDKARTLWKLIAQDLGGYVPHAAAVTLIRACSTNNLVPDVQAPAIS